MKIVRYRVSELDYKTYRVLVHLNLGNQGLMRYFLSSAYNYEVGKDNVRRNEEAVILYDDNDLIVSWAIILETRKCSVCRWKKVIQIYTRKCKQGKGYGSCLMRHIIDTHQTSKLYCNGNMRFFSKYGVKHAK